MTHNNENDKQANETKAAMIDKAARDVLTLARNTLIVKFRFLDTALSRLDPTPSDGATLSTDGVRLRYGPKHVLMCFKNDRDKPAQDYLHAVLHCIFSHMFIGEGVDRRLWDLACDIAVESSMHDLGMYGPGSRRKTVQSPEIERLKAEIGSLTAEKIYHYYRAGGIQDFEVDMLGRIFEADDHRGWHKSRPEPDKNDDFGSSGGRNDLSDPDAEGSEDISADAESAAESLPLEEIMEEWRKIAEKIQEDLETFSREQGDTAGGLMQNLREVTRGRYDYAAFLRKFSVFGENMLVNDEEFDYIFYMYGLDLYGNMPLVEPLEYKEVKRIREFVIAIDTSGSTSGELVQGFLQKTYDILKQSESFFSKINVHIIQCDAAIQEHVRISSEEEFDSYIEGMTIRGLGGTDFRPVFSFVDRLIDEGEFTDLKGMIYFTDGRGTYPARKPGYETAFVFLDNEYNEPEVPPWAIRLVLRDEDLKGGPA